MKSGRPTRNSHLIAYAVIKFLSVLYTRLFLGYRCKDRYRIKKGERVVVLSNHQTDYDPFCIIPCFSRPIYPVATDNIFSGFLGKILRYLNVIPKKKGEVDVRTTVSMLETLRNGASVLLFPEGNRCYAEFQYYVSPSLARFLKSTGATLVLFNIRGGSGVSPRFKHKNRRGRFYGEIRRVIPFEEYSQLDNGELNAIITDGIRVFDSDSGEKYKSAGRAEYLEKMLFVCPKCGGIQTLASEKQFLRCGKCGLTVEYGEDLHLKSADGSFTFSRLVDWWDFQKKYMLELKPSPGETVFSDDGVKLFRTKRYEKKKLLASGRMTATDSSVSVGGFLLEFGKISAPSVVSGGKLTFIYGEDDMMITGGERFNPLKYVFLFNKPRGASRRGKADKYFGLEDIND